MSAIYVISSINGLVKIGRSADARKRFLGLKHSSPVSLHLSHVVEVPADQAAFIEAKIHNEMAAVRRHGEWFEVSIGVAIAIVDRIAGPWSAEIEHSPAQEWQRRNDERLQVGARLAKRAKWL